MGLGKLSWWFVCFAPYKLYTTVMKKAHRPWSHVFLSKKIHSRNKWLRNSARHSVLSGEEHLNTPRTEHSTSPFIFFGSLSTLYAKTPFNSIIRWGCTRETDRDKMLSVRFMAYDFFRARRQMSLFRWFIPSLQRSGYKDSSCVCFEANLKAPLLLLL